MFAALLSFHADPSRFAPASRPAYCGQAALSQDPVYLEYPKPQAAKALEMRPSIPHAAS
jgi:hypothetical protein